MWVKAGERERNKEKCVNGATFLTTSRVSRYRLRDNQFICRNLRGLLERGVQKSMDTEEPKGPVNPSAPPLAIETMLGYTGSMGTALWNEIGRD
jgi:hypothetical protein